ncbi:MAG: hypothetical protein GX443_03230 [Deltaproteobacteria bacterium]|nr:hypothetical protein [Deltaproteobacteria bacterium]
MSPCPVFLLGTVHRDPDGFRRLCVFLRAFDPDCILLECSPYGMEFRRKNGRALQEALNKAIRETSRGCALPLRYVVKHPQVSAIRRQITLPFEYRAARRHHHLTGTPVLLVDHPKWSRIWIRHWPHLLSQKNIQTLVTLKNQDLPPISRIYRLAAACIDNGPAANGESLPFSRWPHDRFTLEREQHLAKRIFSGLQTLDPKRPLFVGGWMHLVYGVNQPRLRDYLKGITCGCALLDRCMREVRNRGSMDEIRGRSPRSPLPSPSTNGLLF